MKAWQDIGFEIEITGDGSPSLRLLASVDPLKDKGESMHHSGGAAAETNLIYGEPIAEILAKITKPKFLVVGLGLGYIEMVIARESLLAKRNAEDIASIASYESVPELREFFISWLQNQELHPEVKSTYDLVLEHVLKGSGVSAADVKSFLLVHFPEVRAVHGALYPEIAMEDQYHCILYDAFSSKTSPFLWEEDFLRRILKEGSAESSVLATYACKGSLKRALKDQGFEVIVREGFQGKRNSTQGRRQFPKM
ncbi:MAG TPA: MnmC family methyltransferase [Bdellovibrio sp.]|uniref:MnmC family methyltransferase n=1 Tax=Bdellovibrio sp. TaxID=28201 RepID=UPI002F1B1A7C